jgi:hypothetical protein
MLRNSFGRMTLGFKMLSWFLGAIDDSLPNPILRRIWPHLLIPAVVLGFGFENAANADAPNSVAMEPSSEVHLALGPAIAGFQSDNGWDTQVGGELHLVRLGDGGRLAAVGEAFGALTFAQDETIRLYLDTYVGLQLTSDLTVGVALAPIVDLHPTRRSLFGIRGTVWAHAGIAPYISASQTWGLGASNHIDVAIGLRVPFSITRF